MPFNLDDGSRPVRNADGTVPEVKPCETYPELFSDWMLSEMKKDKTLIAVTAGTPTAAGFTADKRKELARNILTWALPKSRLSL